MVNIVLLMAALVAGLGLRGALAYRRAPEQGQSEAGTFVTRHRFELLLAASAGIGCMWGQQYAALIALAVLMPPIWSFAVSRLEAFTVAAVYYLAASRDLPQGAGIFFAASAPGILGYGLWMLAGMVNAAVWGLCWQHNPGHRAVAAQFGLVLTAIPPVGVIGWASPLTAAGWFFPSCGLVGLVFTMLLIWLLVSRSNRMVLKLAVAGALVTSLNCIYFVSAGAFPAPQNWVAYDMHLSKLQTGSTSSFFERLKAVTDIAQIAKPHQVILLPESVLPEAAFNINYSAQLVAYAGEELRAKDAIVLIGTEVTRPDGIDNVLMPLGVSVGNLVQRVPVPVGMWRPWSKLTYNTHFLGNGVAVLRGLRAAYFVCYEQLLVFPMVLSAVHDPNILLGASNDWWARETTIPKIQQAALFSWGRLLGVPVLTATNY